jgi:hypothetical protein
MVCKILFFIVAGVVLYLHIGVDGVTGKEGAVIISVEIRRWITHVGEE